VSRVICESAEHYQEVTLAQKSCQHPMDSSAQPELCGDGPDYCLTCPSCDKPFCDQHLVRYDDSELCFGCVKAEMAAEAIAAESVAA
jgi:hypothetical protein